MSSIFLPQHNFYFHLFSNVAKIFIGRATWPMPYALTVPSNHSIRKSEQTSPHRHSPLHLPQSLLNNSRASNSPLRLLHHTPPLLLPPPPPLCILHLAMSDDEYSGSEIERKPPSPDLKRAPVTLSDVDDSADERPSPRAKRGQPDADDDDDIDNDDEDDIKERRDRPHSSKREPETYHDDDDLDDDLNDDDPRDRKDRERKRKKQHSSSRKRSSPDRDEYPDDADRYADGDSDGRDDPRAGHDADDEDERPRKRPLNAMERVREQEKAERRPRRKEVDMTAVENECIVFLERMMKARDDDVRAYRAGRPPLEKIKMLPEVERIMTKIDHRDYLLDNMMLPVFKAWLDRLPDGALPNIDVRTTLLRILSDCRVDEDWLQRLEESQGLGKVIHFLSRSDDHEPNRRIAQKLMEKWARLVYRSNSNFHDLQDEFDKPEDGHRAGKDSVAAERKAALRTVQNFRTTQEKMKSFKHRGKEGTELDMMASTPRPTPFLFTTMAEGSNEVDERTVREVRTNKARTRRVNSTLATLRRINKKGQARGARPSVNGR